MGSELTIERREEEGVLVLDLVGDVDFNTAASLEGEIRQVAEGGNVCIVLNMSSVSLVDSMGMGKLLAAMAGLKSKKGKLVLSNLTPIVSKALSYARLDRVVTICSSVQEAVEKASQNSG